MFHDTWILCADINRNFSPNFVENLLSKNIDFNASVKRNIVSLRVSEDLFDDLTDGNVKASNVARAFESEVKKNIPARFLERSFHYTTAIEYPFTIEPYLQSRYGTGEFAVWYASLTLSTSIYETAFHMHQEENKVHDNENIIYRERAVYDVHCRALLVDLRGKENHYPDLVTDEYTFPQQIAKRVYEEGHPGLLVPSARTLGANTVIFNQKVLSDPRIGCYLTYTLKRNESKVLVERVPGEIYCVIQF